MSVPQQPQGSQKGTHTPRGAQGGDSGAEVKVLWDVAQEFFEGSQKLTHEEDLARDRKKLL